jgi:hypothetical protein
MAVFVVFWLAVALTLIAAIVVPALRDVAKSKAKLALLQTAVDKGQALNPDVVDRIMAQPARRPADVAAPAQRLITVGIILCSTGIGLALMGMLIANIEYEALYPMLGCGTLVACIGVGMIVAAKVARASLVAVERNA